MFLININLNQFLFQVAAVCCVDVQYANILKILVLKSISVYECETFSVIWQYHKFRFITIQILVFLIVLNELNMFEIPSKQLQSYCTPDHNHKQYFSLFNINFDILYLDGFSSLTARLKSQYTNNNP